MAPCFPRSNPASGRKRAALRVRDIKWRECVKDILFEARRKPLTVSRSACVSTGDLVLRDLEGASVKCRNGLARILPIYAAREHLQVGDLDLEFVVKEITDAEEFTAYQSLSEFHYRRSGLHGRTARLIVRSFHSNYPRVIGYVELTTPFYMNKARAAILDGSFAVDGIAWNHWDMATTRRYIHLIARVARCVIYPEFRGLGLGRALLKHAAIFARERWQVAGLKPYFLEISADMLKYVPFASKAGMTFIGETEGNLSRVAKDMAYLLKNRRRVKARTIVKEEACGIVDQQVARMDRAAILMKREGWSLPELKTKLTRLSGSSVLRDFDLFHDIVSLPKPTYLLGLNPQAEDFLRERVRTVGPKNGYEPQPISVRPLSGPIILENISLQFHSRVRRTRETHSIQQAFAISPDEFLHSIVRNLSLSIDPGTVVLVTGSSGSGKTTLLRLFSRALSSSAGQVQLPSNYNPGAFTPIASQRALIEILASHDVRAALHLMGIVGLSDAFVYLKRFDQLSNGQQYRAMLAQLITSGHNVWLADEFCATLDPLTANVIADRLQRLARKLGAVLIVVSSQPDVFAGALKPDQVVQLTTAWEHRVIPGADFLRTSDSGRSRFEAPSLNIAAEYMPAIHARQKRTTVRRGRLTLEKGLLFLKSQDGLHVVNVVDVRHTSVNRLTETDALNDGFETLAQMRRALVQHYPTLRKTSPLTIVAFESPLNSGREPERATSNGLEMDSGKFRVVTGLH